MAGGKAAGAKSAKPKPAQGAKPRAAGREKPALRVGDAAVAAKTGKSWREWFALLDKEGARKLSHREIARHLHARHGLSGWWAQMVTVGYEQARLGRARHERPDGFEISVSRTLAVPLLSLFAAWSDARRRSRWLAEPLAVTKATPAKSLRGRWGDGTSLAVAFYAKPDGKSQVAVTHGKLKDAKAAAGVKAAWAKRLARLKGYLEGR